MSKYRVCIVEGCGECIVDTTTNTVVDTVESLVENSEKLYQLEDLVEDVVYFGKKNPCSIPNCVQDLVDFYTNNEE